MSLLARDKCSIRAKAHFLGLSVIVSAYYQCSGKGDKCRALQRLRIKGDKCRAHPCRLRFDTSFLHFGAETLRFYTSLLHFGAGRVDPYKTIRQEQPPKIIGEKKNRKLGKFSLSLNFPIFLANRNC